MGIRALSWTLCGVVLVVVGCGPTEEDRNRIAAISADPLLQIEPDDFQERRQLEALATAESPAFGRSSNLFGFVYDLPVTNELATLLTPYVEHLTDEGWSEISVRCRDNDITVIARRPQDSYVALAQVSARNPAPQDGEAPPPSRLAVTIEAPHSSSRDNRYVAEARPELDCLAMD